MGFMTDRLTLDEEYYARTIGAILASVATFAIVLLVFIEYPVYLEAAYGLPWYISLSGAMVALVAGFEVHDRITRDLPHVAKVDIDGQIGREGADTDADDVVDSIEEAEEDGAGALLIECNSPGGEVVPSADISNAIEDFDGPTVAYARDTCGSGAYMAATAADHIVAREGSHVGSIGVVGSQVNLSEFLNEKGIEYESFTAGEFKDAGVPFRGLEDDEREYIQNLIDSHYEMFVDHVAANRGLSCDSIRELGARIFLGREAVQNGLADEIGDRDRATEWALGQLEDESVEQEDSRLVEYTEPGFSLPMDIGATVATKIGRGIGASIADRIDISSELNDRLR